MYPSTLLFKNHSISSKKTVSKNNTGARKQHSNLTVRASFLEPDIPQFSSLLPGMCLHRDKTEFTANSQIFLLLASLQAGKLISLFVLVCIENLNGVSHPLSTGHITMTFSLWQLILLLYQTNDWKALEVLKIYYLETTFAHPQLQIMSCLWVFVLYLQWGGKSQVGC